MQGTVDGFSNGIVTPVVAFLSGWIGGALGLRCTVRAQLDARSWRPGWLALGAAAIGSGIWTMHFVAMTGFHVAETAVHYDPLTTCASLVLAIVMTGIGIFIVGYRGSRGPALVTGGTVTGLGIASMHYLGMAGIRLDGRLTYNTWVVGASVVVAAVAAVAALWTVGQARSLWRSAAASLAMGLAVTGMHYTGMASMTVELDPGPLQAPGTDEATAQAGETVGELLAPMVVGPLAILLLAAVIVLCDPKTALGRPRRRPLRPVVAPLPSEVNPGRRIPHQRPRARTPQNR